MSFSLVSIIEAAVFSIVLSLDVVAMGFAYGFKKIKIPISSAMIITLISTGITGVAMLVGNLLRCIMPDRLTECVCFIILFLFGSVKLMDSLTKSFIRKHSDLKKELRFSMFNLRFILHLYADPEEADVDHSMDLSPKESVFLAVALSLDSLTAGLGASIGNINWVVVLIAALAANLAAVVIGFALGNKLARKMQLDLSWVGGAILIILAFCKFF